jgi:hypothetical protein
MTKSKTPTMSEEDMKGWLALSEEERDVYYKAVVDQLVREGVLQPTGKSIVNKDGKLEPIYKSTIYRRAKR